MISPELVRRYAFFSTLPDARLKDVAMLGDEWRVAPGEVICEAGQAAARLFLLMQGSVDLYLVVKGGAPNDARHEHFIGEISPGEVLGISALLEPFVYTLTARAATPSELIRLEAAGLRALAQSDSAFAGQLYLKTAQTLQARLGDARVRLAAAWA
jgi:CRP-like cAMP-binding protein